MVQIERMTCAKEGEVVYSFWAPANDVFGEESLKFSSSSTSKPTTEWFSNNFGVEEHICLKQEISYIVLSTDTVTQSTVRGDADFTSFKVLFFLMCSLGVSGF